MTGRLPLAGLIAAVFLAGLAVVVAAAAAWHDEDGLLLLSLAALALLSEAFDFALFPNVRVSLSAALILAAATVSGLQGVAVIASVAVAGDYVVHRRAGFKVAFNEGSLLLSGAAYAGVLAAFSVGPGPDDWPALLGAALLGSAANFAVNSGLVALAIGLDSGRRPAAVWREAFPGLFPHYVLLGLLAAVMASAYDGWGLGGLALLLAPLGTAWFALRQHTERARRVASPFRGA